MPTSAYDSSLQRIDETRLATDVGYRFGYVSRFIGFDAEDIAAIHASAEHLAPLVPSLVDAVYDRLFQFDATKRFFVPAGLGYEGPIAPTLGELTLDHPQIKFRKQHLARYFERLVTAEYDTRLVGYLDLVGAIHTPDAGSREIEVPWVHMNVLLGFVADALVNAICGLKLPRESEVRTLRAFTKLLWIQGDLIGRHYVGQK